MRDSVSRTARRSTLFAWRRPFGGLLPVLAAVYIFAATFTPQAQAQTEIWSATLTVGTFAVTMDTTFVGYSDGNRGPTIDQGQLSDTDFEHNGVTYTVNGLYTVSGDLQLVLDKGLPDPGPDWTLSVGGSTFIVNAGARQSRGTYVWSNAGVSWSDGGAVSVSLTDASGPPPRPGPTTPEPEPPPEPRLTAPGAPRDLTAVSGDGQVVLTWRAPRSNGGAAIRDYEYRIGGRSGIWASIGSTKTTHTVTGLVNGTEYTFQVRAVNRIGKSFAPNQVETTPEAPEVFTLDFAHFANGDGTTSDLVFVNVASHPIRPALYFYDTGGQPLAAESVVDITGDLEITEDGSLSIQTKMEPLGELTISTHGQGGAGERIGEGGRGRSHRRGLAL